ncbi:MAG: prenyltransferase [Candidatus Omnitrophica bacterium]|nr:prenyltransferase [Candidatus Omnitrophota bacterium]
MGGNILGIERQTAENNIIRSLFSMVRYRFFLFAGIFPYLLGQAMAFNAAKSLDWRYFWWGFLGIFLVLIGVELFNEYFDAKEGGDRIFSQDPIHVPCHFFPLGVLVFSLAFLIGLYVTSKVGWPILLFSFLGFLGAYFYVGPPIRWIYRGLGEMVIAISYGPFMVLGSYYLQAHKITLVPILPSLICGLSIFCLAILNEIPDYYQDRLVGKKNLVVRLGRQKSIKLLSLSLASLFILLLLSVVWAKAPLSALLPLFLIYWIVRSLAKVKKDYDNPQVFRSLINAVVVIYLVIVCSLGIGYMGG